MTFDFRKVHTGVTGLGYVGPPLAAEFGRRYSTIGFVQKSRSDDLEKGTTGSP